MNIDKRRLFHAFLILGIIFFSIQGRGPAKKGDQFQAALKSQPDTVWVPDTILIPVVVEPPTQEEFEEALETAKNTVAKASPMESTSLSAVKRGQELKEEKIKTILRTYFDEILPKTEGYKHAMKDIDRGKDKESSGYILQMWYISENAYMAATEYLLYGIPTGQKLSQGILESNCGKSAHNIYSIHYSKTFLKEISHMLVPGKPYEYYHDNCKFRDPKGAKGHASRCKNPDKFFNFKSTWYEHRAHSKFLTSPSRVYIHRYHRKYRRKYGHIRGHYESLGRSDREKMSYAIDPKYVDKLLNINRRWNIDWITKELDNQKIQL
jgi:flagellum-specific peptidoglycan hydrolase FlgJ